MTVRGLDIMADGDELASADLRQPIVRLLTTTLEHKDELARLNSRGIDVQMKLMQHDLRFDGIDKRFDGIDKRFDGIDKRLDRIDERFNGMEQRFDGMEQRFDGRFGRIEDRFVQVLLVLQDIRDGKRGPAAEDE